MVCKLLEKFTLLYNLLAMTNSFYCEMMVILSRTGKILKIVNRLLLLL